MALFAVNSPVLYCPLRATPSKLCHVGVLCGVGKLMGILSGEIRLMIFRHSARVLRINKTAAACAALVHLAVASSSLNLSLSQ